MATRSMIGVQRDNGTIEAIYCHWDGYMEHHGPILLNAYNGPRKIEALIRQGDLSCLGSILVADATGAEDEDACSNINGYVGGDGDDSECSAKVYADLDDLRARQTWCEYFYVHKEGQWYVASSDETDELRTLEGWFKPEELLTNPV
jgi:hypothetical protein